MTPSELVEFARQKYNAEGDSFYSDAELYNTIYAAHLEFARETLCIERTYTTTSVSGQQEYSFPENTFMIKRVTYDGLKLKPITFAEDDALTGFNAGTTQTGTPDCYVVWNRTLILRNIPDSSSKTIKIYSINMPSEITQTSVLEIPVQFQMDTVYYMLAEMFAKDKDFSASTYYRNLWTDALIKGKQFVRKQKRGDGFVVVNDSELLNQPPIGFF